MVRCLTVEVLHENFDGFFVIDVREKEEFKAEHIRGTTLSRLCCMNQKLAKAMAKELILAGFLCFRCTEAIHPI